MKLLQDMISPHLEHLLSAKSVEKATWESMLQPSREASQGDLTLPCFPFASVLRMAPQAIADALAEQIADKYPGRYITIEVAEDGENGQISRYEPL